MDQQQLRRILVAELAAGRLARKFLEPAIAALGDRDVDEVPLAVLHDELLALGGAVHVQLANHIASELIGSARKRDPRDHAGELTGLCLPDAKPWQSCAAGVEALDEFLSAARARHRARTSADETDPGIESAWRDARERLDELSLPWENTAIGSLVEELRAKGLIDADTHAFVTAKCADGADRELAELEASVAAFRTHEDRKTKAEILDGLLAWPSDRACAHLLAICEAPWARLRCAVALTHRFGLDDRNDWIAVQAWLREQGMPPAKLQDTILQIRQRLLEPIESEPTEQPPERRSALERLRDVRAQARDQRREAPPKPTPPAPAVEHEEEAPPPRKPSVWQAHLQTFFVDNWYIFAGLLMLVVGCSIVAFYTWDEHWIWRYTLLPAMLGGFTFGLAGLGRWLDAKATEFRGTSASLRGAAIGLLPVNFMTVTLLAREEQIAEQTRLWWIFGVAALYLAVFGWGLRRWCSAVFRPIGAALATALLLINGLVVLGPVAGAFEDAPIPLVLGTGFYHGFLALAFAVVYFTRKHLTVELAEEKRVPWFVGGTLVITFLQVFAWAHVSLDLLPQPHTYALMTILAGGLVLFVERRVLALRHTEARHGAESFLGFALILLGCMLASGEPVMRIFGFATAGAVWLYQGRGRRHEAHQWIGLGFLGVGLASIGLLDGLPAELRPAVGFGVAAFMHAVSVFASRRDHGDLVRAGSGLRNAAVFLTTVVAVLGQWRDGSEPLLAAGYLATAAAVLVWRAHAEDRLRLMHAAMVIVALILPYLGCVDLEGRSIHGNTMVFGLAVVSMLWLLQNWLWPTEQTRKARSTVLWSYGALAVAGMVLRVAIERGTPGDALWYRQAMDYTGPLLMAGALVFAAYLSRSLVPSGMAAIIVVILFPELKARFEDTFTTLGWGTGLGSSCSALALVVVSFFLRRWKFLSGLGPGDRFLGRFEFPARRYDWTLFTWPLIASAIFLVCRTETWTLYRNIASNLTLKTAVAVFLTGATWTCLAAYGRQRSVAGVATHLGWIWFGIGITLIYGEVAEEHTFEVPFLALGLLLTGLVGVYRALETRAVRVAEVLTRPTAAVLAGGSLLLAIAMTILLADEPLTGYSWALATFLIAQLIWHAIRVRRFAYGGVLFALFISLHLGIKSATEGWFHALEDPAGLRTLANPVLGFLLGVPVVHAFLERSVWYRDRLRALVVPFQWGTAIVTAGFCLSFFYELEWPPGLTAGQKASVLALLLLGARNWRSAPAVWTACLLGYLWFGTYMSFVDEPVSRYLMTPWHLALFAVSLGLLVWIGVRLKARTPRLVEGSWPVLPVTGRPRDWLLVTAATLAGMATLLLLIDPEWRADSNQVSAPYLGMAALIAAAGLWRRVWPIYPAVVLFAIGNVQVVRLFFGVDLIEQGLSEVHLVCIGFVLTLVPIAISRRLLADGARREAIERATMVFAASTLVLLAGNYLVRHNLQDITSFRFGISGVLAYFAALAFRQVARVREPHHVRRADFCESAYHFGVTIALWCAALLIPAMRGPELALLALSIPVYYFAFRAEATWRAGRVIAARYRTSAAALGFLLLALYAARAAFQVVLFPDEVVQTDHYHHGSPYVIVIGLILLRLHRLGGSYWLAFYGGLGLIVGSFFAVTALPALRPFEHVVNAAWTGLVLAHFWTVVTSQRSPLRSGLQTLGGITEEEWTNLRGAWGITLFAAAQILAMVAVLDHGGDTLAVAPLIAGAASIAFHHGVLRRQAWYFALGGAQVLLALHADFFVESYLDRTAIIWALIGLWVVGIGGVWMLREAGRPIANTGLAFGGLAFAIVAHVMYHHPSSATGLWAVALLGMTAVALPRPGPVATLQDERIAAGLVLFVPTWLAYFGQASLVRDGWGGAFHPWPVLAAGATALVTGAFAHVCKAKLAAEIEGMGSRAPALVHQLLNLLRVAGTRVGVAVAVLVLAATAVVQVSHYGQVFAAHELGLLCLLYAALVWIAWLVTRALQSALAFTVAELCAVAVFLAIRGQLTLTTDFWTPEYDVWASLITAFLLTGTKELAGPQPRMVSLPVTVSLVVLPVIGIAITLFHGLGTNVALLVVGLHSLMFSFLGKNDRESPYNFLAVGGFVSFVLMVFWSKLELDVVHAYVLPVGVGVLLLLQLFRNRLSAGQRNRIRLVTVLAMLGSTGYYALIDGRHPVGFNLTLLVLCLLAMGMGGFLRIRMYLTLGFTGVLVSLGSIIYRALAGMERAGRMTAVGILVLVIGAALVIGAIYYKTHREPLNARIDAWRRRLGEWE